MTTRAERRKGDRVQIYLDAKWEGVLGFGNGTISDISIGGCHVLTGGNVKEKELVRVEIQLPDEKEVLLWGEVTNYVPELGFGLRFTGFSDEEQEMISLLLDYSRQKPLDAETDSITGGASEQSSGIQADHASESNVTTPAALVLQPPTSATNPQPLPSNQPLQSNDSTDEIAQLRELTASVKTLLARTLVEMNNVIEAFSTVKGTSELESILASWFKSAKGCIGLLPYGELRRALKNGATTIQQAYYLHAYNNGLMGNQSAIQHIEETYKLERMTPAERPGYVLKSFACAHRDMAFKIGHVSGIFPQN